MKVTVILGFFLIFLLIIASLVAVICLIVKETRKTKHVPMNNSSVQREDRVEQNTANNINISKERISDDDINYLKRVKDLKDNGVLSEEEYNAERDKILRK